MLAATPLGSVMFPYRLMNVSSSEPVSPESEIPPPIEAQEALSFNNNSMMFLSVLKRIEPGRCPLSKSYGL